MNILQTITEEFQLTPTHASNIVALIDEGNTIPFIARYRKEMTGSCDDQVLRELFDRLTYLRNLEKRKEEVANSITEQGKMTDEIRDALAKAVTLTEVEDIYRPYKQKRKTRASVAIAKGLQPLADAILAQDKTLDVRAEAEKYITEEVKSVDEALAGAQDIIAEIISDDAPTRKKLRNFFFKHGEIVSSYAKGKEAEDEAKTYGMYADYNEPVSEIKSHRVLALNRGEKEEFLKVSIVVDGEFAKRITAASFLKDGGGFRFITAAGKLRRFIYHYHHGGTRSAAIGQNSLKLPLCGRSYILIWMRFSPLLNSVTARNCGDVRCWSAVHHSGAAWFPPVPMKPVNTASTLPCRRGLRCGSARRRYLSNRISAVTVRRQS